MVALLSPEYLSSEHCQAEWQNAIAGDPLNTKSRLILLRVAECEPAGLAERACLLGPGPGAGEPRAVGGHRARAPCARIVAMRCRAVRTGGRRARSWMAKRFVRCRVSAGVRRSSRRCCGARGGGRDRGGVRFGRRRQVVGSAGIRVAQPCGLLDRLVVQRGDGRRDRGWSVTPGLDVRARARSACGPAGRGAAGESSVLARFRQTGIARSSTTSRTNGICADVAAADGRARVDDVAQCRLGCRYRPPWRCRPGIDRLRSTISGARAAAPILPRTMRAPSPRRSAPFRSRWPTPPLRFAACGWSRRADTWNASASISKMRRATPSTRARCSPRSAPRSRKLKREVPGAAAASVFCGVVCARRDSRRTFSPADRELSGAAPSAFGGRHRTRSPRRVLRRAVCRRGTGCARPPFSARILAAVTHVRHPPPRPTCRHAT